MAQLFAKRKKSSREDAISSLSSHVKSVCDNPFKVVFESDDGGTVLTLYIEVEEPSAPLSAYLHDALVTLDWEGWRYVTIKTPPGYISAVMEREERDDW
jgi:hypothetical protein